MSRSQLLPQSTPAPGQISRQPTRVLVEARTPDAEAASASTTNSTERHALQRQKSQAQKIVKRPSRLNLERKPTQLDSNRLPMTMDAARNLRQEPTDQEIKRQIKRWKTEFALKNNRLTDPPPKQHTQPKHSRSFYELRKAMVNREDVSLEQSRFVVQSISELESKKSHQRKHTDHTNLTPGGEKKSQLLMTQKQSCDYKMYDGEKKFEFPISKDFPPGFKISTEVSQSNKECKAIVDKKEKETEIHVRREIDELLQLWSTSGYLKNIEQCVLAYPAKRINSVGEISHYIGSPDADYLRSVSIVQGLIDIFVTERIKA